MRLPVAVVALLAITAGAAADPVFIDQLMEMPLESLQQQFPKLRNDGCYQIGPDRFLRIEVDRKERKPSRISLSSDAPCRRPEEGPALEVRERTGIDLGAATLTVLEKMGRPDASAAPEGAFKRFGETEYFYICRTSEGCARHTSVFVRNGLVSAISSWYSE